ncbi:MAG: hypothetical protein BEN19_03265 [Epulopiscium sp. Nuni2H_MBin003]|nr:MAG: hypothetical protein BEN19_03265 [Epulopiscium sp. Nuni2H_MBin003]
MRVRGQFTKEGNVKFVGHLDTMRLFQRAIKIANIPVAYSEGFNPHSKVYFALPLSVGVSSVGEYIEIKTTADIDLEEARHALNKVLPIGIKLTSLFEVIEGTPTLMSQVNAAAYVIIIEDEDIDKVNNILNQPKIMTTKMNKKKKQVELDIKPLILDYSLSKNEDAVVMQVKLLAGSTKNLSPDLLVNTIGKDLDYHVKRLDLYTLEDDEMVSLNA